MHIRSDILGGIDAAFGDSPRPVHFTDFSHCEECAEHDATLLAHTPDTISLKELGNPGWDPLCYVNTQGFHYFMPGWARLTLGRGQDSYLFQFLCHSAPIASSPKTHGSVGPSSRCWSNIRDAMREEVERNCEMKSLERRIRRLQGTTTECS